MRKTTLIIFLLAAASLASAYPVRISSWSVEADAKTLNRLNFSIYNVSKNSGAIYADLRDDSEYSRLLDNGFNAVKLPDHARENALRLHQDKSLHPPRYEYFTNPQYNQFMVDTAAQFPNICTLIQAGTSIQGRPLYFLKITDNPNQEEAEPEFKYISSMHGNEVVGYDMCIRLIQLLTGQYGSNTRITNLVNNTEIWICPMMNPDGFVLGQRYNAAGIDLNRNFPMPTGEQHPDGNAWAQENVAIMNLLNDHSFALSANFHGGALVVNYPWDYTYSLAPDNALIIQSALTYSITNLPMFNSDEFPQGITNGAAWYVITGSMQDWNYGFTNCIEMTMEIGEEMWPPASTLDTYWSQNQESMLAYMEFVHRGMHGLVTSASGNALDATITVQDNAKTVQTDPQVGDYHRLLLPGTYTVTAEAYGYVPETTQITVPASGSAQHNFILEPASSVNFTGQARDPQGNGLAGLEVSLDTEPASSATTDASGSFQFAGIYEGNYRILFRQGGQQIWSTDFNLSEEENRQVFIVSEPVVLFSDACNDISNWTATSPWGVTTLQGESVIADSPAGNYANHITKTLRLTNPISLQNIIDPMLAFDATYALESGYDFVNVQASETTANWVTLGSLTGTQTAWQTLSYSLAQFTGQDVYVRFVIDTDWNVTADGIYLDDIVISGINANELIYGDANGDRRISKSDAASILAYSIGLDPLPGIDPRPWEAGRIEACDLDADDVLDDFDSYLAFRYLGDPAWRLPAQTGTPENPGDPGLTAAYNGNLVVNIEHPELLRSLSFCTSPVDLLQVTHSGTIHNNLFSQVVNQDNDTYGFAGFNVDHISLEASLQPDPPDFILQYSLNGESGLAAVSTDTAGDDPSVPVPVLELLQSQPNPFRSGTLIAFSLPREQAAFLGIYNHRGQLVRTLVSGQQKSGFQQLFWDGRDESGTPVASGIYLSRLQSGGEALTRKLIRIK